MDVLITYGIYAVAFLLILVGVAGTIIPALPGIPMIFAGAWLIAYMEDYLYFGWGTLIALGVLTVISIIIDWVSQTMGAQKAGATKLGLTGALLGTIIGIPFGLVGIFLFPVIGAFVGEMIGHRDMRKAGKVSWATWIGMIAGIAAKLAIAFMMIGIMCVMRFV
jgi:uncharacterized protein YqgC (DUF456 family)